MNNGKSILRMGEKRKIRSDVQGFFAISYYLSAMDYEVFNAVLFSE